MKRLAPAILLFFLSPAIGELLSGSAPPVEFFQPIGFLVITCLYGSGALLVRELTVRWGKGWPTLFTLGAAYGIIEEGLMVKSFFDPEWVDIGILGSYGRWAGVNWVWSMELTIYHSVISIAIPIFLVGLIFPDRRQQSWLDNRSLVIFITILIIDVIFGFIFLTPYRPPASPYIIAIILVGELMVLSQRIPRNLFKEVTRTPIRPSLFWVIGFIGTCLFFVVSWAIPNTHIPAVATLLIGIALILSAARLVLRISGNGYCWTDRHQLALIIGVLTFFILLSPIREFSSEKTDNSAGMAIVGLIAASLLFWLWWRVSKREREKMLVPMSYLES